MVGTSQIDKVGLDYSKSGKIKMAAGSVYSVSQVHGGAGVLLRSRAL